MKMRVNVTVIHLISHLILVIEIQMRWVKEKMKKMVKKSRKRNRKN